MARKSKIEDLPDSIRSAVLAAIEAGRTIDDIVDLIRGMGGDASRSGVGRFTKDFRELAQQQRQQRAIAEAFGREFGTADDLQGRMMIQLLTSITTRAIMPIAMGEEVEIDGLELSRLAKAVKDTTSAAKIDVERETKIREEAAKAARSQAAADAMVAGRAAGASEESLSKIRAGILGMSA